MQATRAARHHIRVRCLVRCRGRVLEAVTTNVSESGIALRARGRAEWAPVPGDVLEIEPRADGLSIPMQANVVWSDTREQDIDGAEVCGLGARFSTQENVPAFLRYVETARHAVLLVYTEPSFGEEADAWLAGTARVYHARTLADAMNALLSESVSAIVCDESMPYPGPADFLATVRECFPRAPWVRVVACTDPKTALLTELINTARVFHFLHKPVDRNGFLACINLAIHQSDMAVDNDALRAELERTNMRLERENAYLRRRVAHESPSSMIGQSPAFLRVMEDLQRVAAFDTTVHLRGETGTGKELAARAIHAASKRSAGPFVVQNCAGMTETLLQSALFGHKRGAFTGADRDRPGVFQEAHGGTLFLDEAAELSAQTQAMLLRALQSGEVTPVGASKPESVDVRIVSATHKDLREEVAGGRFREDLFYRLVVVELRMPPLRERSEDVALLAEHFYAEFCRRYGKPVQPLSPHVLAHLASHRWPGNIRELENEVERLVVMPSGALPERDVALTPSWTPPAAPPMQLARALPELVAEFESRLLLEALTAHRGNKSQVARSLGIPRQTLLDRLKRLGLS